MTADLVHHLQTAVVSKPFSQSRIVESLDALLTHLSTPEGKTDENCRFVDSYFMEHEEWMDLDLADVVHDVFADISGALHDTCTSPEVARNFDSTPEQLLARLRNK